MLDFTPQGLDRISTLATYLGGTAIVTLAILVAVGFAYFVAGKNGGTSHAQERGFRMVGLGIGAVMILSTIGSAISFGISQGDATLMPEGAQQQDVTVEREAATISCPSTGTWEADDHEGAFGSSYATQEESLEGREALDDLGLLTAYEERLNDIWEDEYDGADPDDPPIDKVRLNSVRWHPDGAQGACDSSNHNLMSGTEVEIEAVQYPDSVQGRDMTIPADEAQ